MVGGEPVMWQDWVEQVICRLSSRVIWSFAERGYLPHLFPQQVGFFYWAKVLQGDMLRFIYQTSDQPGTAVGTSGTTGAIPYHDNTIQYREIPGSTFWPTGTGNNLSSEENLVTQNYPNPVEGTTSVKVTLSKPGALSLVVSSMVGQQVMEINKGNVSAGNHQITFDCSSLPAGVYFYTVKVGKESSTLKMVVK